MISFIEHAAQHKPRINYIKQAHPDVHVASKNRYHILNTFNIHISKYADQKKKVVDN